MAHLPSRVKLGIRRFHANWSCNLFVDFCHVFDDVFDGLVASGTRSQSRPGKEAGSGCAAKPAAAPAAGPTAIIDTTAGKLTCTLFPDKAPIGVANFIGLAQGTKDWTNPVSHAKKHGVPLYDGTIFHRVIPEFMIQGGDPAGTRKRGDWFRVQERNFPDSEV